MLKDGTFSADEATEFNIRLLSSAQSTECERRICELAELAEQAADAAVQLYEDGYGIYEIAEVISTGLCIAQNIEHEGALSINVERLKFYVKAISSNDKAVFAELFIDELSKREITLAERDFFSSVHEDEAFVYVKNPLADEAYDVFSQDFDNPRLSYSQTLKDAARFVSGGKAEYCLLPFEEHGGARIASVAALIFAEDLKINAVTPVFGPDGASDMKYALLSRNFRVPRVSREDDRYFEIRISSDDGLSELFLAAEQLGAAIHKVNTVSFDTEDGFSEYFEIVFRRNGEDFVSLITYLTLFCPTYTAVGIYNNLE